MVREIIGEIQSLEGENLGDIFKKFYLYVDANKNVISPEIENILNAFNPGDKLQKIFKLKLIDKWQRASEIVRIFEDEDIFYFTQVLKCKWYFTSVEVNSSELVNEILPNLSYSMRVKVIKQYSKFLRDTNRAEEIYNRLKQRYGTQCALTILPACSQEFVSTVLHNAVINLKPAIIIALFRCYPDVIVDLFCFILECKAAEKRVYNCFNLDKYGNIFALIASKYPQRFLDTYVRYSRYFPYMKLGNRTTKKIVKTNAAIIIKNYRIFTNILNVKSIVRCMSSSQIEELQAACFPETVALFFKQFWNLDQLENLVSHLKEDKRQQILLRNFKKCYGKEFNVDVFNEVIDLTLILSIPTEMRIKWIQSKLPTLDNDSNTGEYMSYLPPEIALPKLKEMIGRQTEMNIRAHLVKCMMHSVKRYKNSLNSLLDCISFVVRRLRNDSQLIRDKVLSELHDMKDVLLSLPTEQWIPIDELIDLVKINDEIFYFKYYLREILTMKIRRYFAEGVPMEDHLKKYLSANNYDFRLCQGTPYQKNCMEFFLSIFQTLSFTNDKEKQEHQESLFLILCDYNLTHKNDPIKYPGWLLSFIEQLLMSKEYRSWNKTSIINVVRKQAHLKSRIYNKVFPVYMEPEIVTYILNNDPTKIGEHKEAVLKEILNSYKFNEYANFFKKITLYRKFGLPQALENQSLWVLQTDEVKTKGYESRSKPNAVIVLSILMPPSEFISTIKPYKPIKGQLDRYSDANQLKYNIQKAIASSLKHVSTLSEILYFIKSFAVGDYLKLIVGSLNSICLKVPEKKILPLLIQWLDCPVSLRKHFIRAYYKVAPVADAGKLIVSLLEKEKNVSLRLILLQHVYKYFLAEPSEECFAVFKAGYSLLKSEDVTAVDDLFDLRHIPDLFVGPYIKLLWEAVELKEGPLVAGKKKGVIDMINADILSLLSEEFCDRLVKQIFLSQSLTEFTRFITIYLVHAPDEVTQTTRLEKVSTHMGIVIEKRWNEFNLNRHSVFQARDTIFGLMESICLESLQKTQLNASQLLKRLELFVLSQIPAADVLDILLLLEITIFISKNDMENDTFITELAKFCEELLIENCKTYGDQVIATLVSQLPYCLQKSKLQLAKVLLSNHTCYQTLLMALELIGTDINHDLPTYKDIIEFLLECSHPYVKAAAGRFLRRLNSNVHVQ